MAQIIIQTAPGPETEFEKEYIYGFVLASADSMDNSHRVVVFSSNRRRKRPLDLKKGDVLVHLANENLRYNYSFLSSDHTILRSYYHPFILRKHCYAIPLGWQSGFANTKNTSGEHNKHIWTFIGQIKGYREPMYKAFESLRPHFSKLSKEWNAGRLSNEDVQQVYLDSIFALVPFGTIHADTIRIMEVLEWGCIPVGVYYFGQDYYKYIFGDHPFVIGKDWSDARNQVEKLLANSDALASKQNEVKNWYAGFKENFQKDIADILSGMEPSRGSQWKYQQEGHHNIKMLILWYLHFYVGYDYLIVKRIVGQWFSRVKGYFNLG